MRARLMLTTDLHYPRTSPPCLEDARNRLWISEDRFCPPYIPTPSFFERGLDPTLSTAYIIWHLLSIVYIISSFSIRRSPPLSVGMAGMDTIRSNAFLGVGA